MLKKFNSIFTKLFTCLLIVSLVPVSIIVFRDVTITKQAFTEVAYKTLETAALEIAFKLDVFVAEQLNMLDARADNDHFVNALKHKHKYTSNLKSQDKLNRALGNLLKQNSSHANSASLFNIQGVAVASSQTSSIRNIKQQTYFQTLLSTEKAQLIPIKRSKHGRILSFIAGVKDSKGQLIGALKLNYNIDILQQLLRQSSGITGSQSSPILIDKHNAVITAGQLLANFNDDAVKQSIHFSYKTPSTFNTLNNRKKMHIGEIKLKQADSEYHLSAAIVPLNIAPWQVIYVQTKDEFHAPINQIVYSNAGLLGFAVFLCFVIAMIASQIFSKPLTRLTNIANKVAHGELNLKAEEYDGDEIGDLAKAFNFMTNRLNLRSEAISANQLQLIKAQAIAHFGSFELNINNFLMSWSDECYNMFGYENNITAPTLEAIFERLNEADQTILQARIEELTETQATEVEPFECLIILPHQANRIVIIKLEKSTNQAHKSVVFGSVNDITKRRKAEQALSTSEERLSIALEATNDGLWDWDLINQRVYYSPQWFSMLGFNNNELADTADSFFNLIHPNDNEKVSLHIEAVLNNQSTEINIEFRMLTKKAAVIWVHCRGMVVTRNDDDSPIRAIGTNTDISERKRIEQEIRSFNEELESRVNERTKQLEQTNQKLQQSKEKAESANKTKSAFLANMSHEIRTPMNAIIGLTNLLKRTVLNQKQQHYIYNIGTSSENLLMIINDILDFSKIEAGKLTIEKTSFDLTTIISNLTDLFARRAHEKGLEFIVHIETNVPVKLIGDPLRISQILINLCSNAIKFTNHGQVMVHITLQSQEDNAACLRFSVKDSGIGLSYTQKARLFNAFTQADTSTTRQYGGTGLGLTISKQLVNLMDGEINVESKEKRGSHFYFDLPFYVDTFENHFQLPQAWLKGQPILVIDDNQATCNMLCSVLNELGFKAQGYYSGETAIAALKAQEHKPEFKLTLMDWQMSHPINSPQTWQQLQHLTNFKNCHLLAMTHLLDNIEEKIAQIPDHATNVTKPISTAQLFKLVTRLLLGQTVNEQSKVTQVNTEIKVQFTDFNVLLVEDNEINQEIAKELLLLHGIKVTIAANGQEAIEQLGNQAFNLVLMDVQMPVMDGYQATKAIRLEPKWQKLPILAMTANVMTRDIEHCLAAGMNDHIAKPINEKTLIETIVRWTGDQFISQGMNQKNSVLANKKNFENIEKPIQMNSLDTKNQPLLNTEFCLNQLGGNQVLVNKMLLKFQQDFHTFIADCEALISDNQTLEAERQIHTLKGVSGNLGLSRLHYESKQVDDVLKQALESKTATIQHPVDNSMFQALNATLKLTMDTIEGYLVHNDNTSTFMSPEITRVDKHALLTEANALLVSIKANEFIQDQTFNHFIEQLPTAIDKDKQAQFEQAFMNFDMSVCAQLLEELIDYIQAYDDK